MAKWQNKFEEIKNGYTHIQKNNPTINSNTQSDNKINRTIEQAKKLANDIKKISLVIKNILLAIFNTILFLISNPIGWFISGLVMLILGIIIIDSTLGSNFFSSSCPIDYNTQTIYNKECKTLGDGNGKGRTSGGDSSTSNNAGGTGEWAKNGSGSTNISGWAAWQPRNLPAELKKYALNPESVGMKYLNSTGWVWPGNQCTNLSGSLMYAIWEKNGQHPLQMLGNGKDVARNWASKFGGKVTSTPTAGAVFSSIGVGGIYGHTGVVSHVFENGDFLTVEQNSRRLSGENNNQTNNWHYAYYKKKQITTDGMTFYDPSTVGYKLVSNALSH